LAFLLLGILLVHFSGSYLTSSLGLVAIGVGLSAGFPIVMGLVGNRYESLSGTAFSIILFIALSGNMIVNYIMGFIVDRFGVQQLTTVSFILWCLMALFAILIIRKNKSYKSI
jgi:fucose permease